MTERQRRVFVPQPAVREAVPLCVAVCGGPGVGKTCSALRLATGMRRVTGGRIDFIDTEGRRGLAYADNFDFHHVDFKAPFGSLDYLDAIETSVEQGARTIVVDSMTNEHEGEGGVLDQFDREIERAMAAAQAKHPDRSIRREAYTWGAWNVAKAGRKRLLQRIVQLGVNVVFCFRAREKLELERGKDPVKLGFVQVGGKDIFHEMTLSILLHPGAKGVPTWETKLAGEQDTIKVLGQLQHVFAPGEPLNEMTGEKLALWAAGDGARNNEDRAREYLSKLETLGQEGTLEQLEQVAVDLRRYWPKPHGFDQYTRIGAAYRAALKAVKDRSATSAPSAPSTARSMREMGED